jgi:hypothetical protein
MAQSRVTFRARLIGIADWQIEAHCPGVGIEYIAGFESDTEAYHWIASDKSKDWLKERGFADASTPQTP